MRKNPNLYTIANDRRNPDFGLLWGLSQCAQTVLQALVYCSWVRANDFVDAITYQLWTLSVASPP